MRYKGLTLKDWENVLRWTTKFPSNDLPAIGRYYKLKAILGSRGGPTTNKKLKRKAKRVIAFMTGLQKKWDKYKEKDAC